MTKDVKIALAAGFLLGIVSAIIAITFPKLVSTLTKDNSMSVAISPTIEVTPKIVQTDLRIDIEYPKDGEMVEDRNIDLKGKTDPDYYIVVDSQKETQVVKPKDDGSFTAEIDISEGANNIYITSYTKDGDSETKTITVLRTSNKL